MNLSLVFKEGLISEMNNASRINNFSNFSLPNISTMSNDGATLHIEMFFQNTLRPNMLLVTLL